jgi:hypothetical protein
MPSRGRTLTNLPIRIDLLCPSYAKNLAVLAKQRFVVPLAPENGLKCRRVLEKAPALVLMARFLPCSLFPRYQEIKHDYFACLASSRTVAIPSLA